MYHIRIVNDVVGYCFRPIVVSINSFRLTRLNLYRVDLAISIFIDIQS